MTHQTLGLHSQLMILVPWSDELSDKTLSEALPLTKPVRMRELRANMPARNDGRSPQDVVASVGTMGALMRKRAQGRRSTPTMVPMTLESSGRMNDRLGMPGRRMIVPTLFNEEVIEPFAVRLWL